MTSERSVHTDNTSLVASACALRICGNEQAPPTCSRTYVRTTDGTDVRARPAATTCACARVHVTGRWPVTCDTRCPIMNVQGGAWALYSFVTLLTIMHTLCTVSAPNIGLNGALGWRLIFVEPNIGLAGWRPLSRYTCTTGTMVLLISVFKFRQTVFSLLSSVSKFNLAL